MTSSRIEMSSKAPSAKGIAEKIVRQSDECGRFEMAILSVKAGSVTANRVRALPDDLLSKLISGDISLSGREGVFNEDCC